MPIALQHLLTGLPAYPGSVLFASGMNFSVLDHLPADTCQQLEHKTIRLHARDVCIAFDFTYRNGRFHAVEPHQPVDLTITGDMADFYRLARHPEDLDSLIFQRALTLEGETRLSHLIQDTLGTLDLSLFDPVRFFPSRFQRGTIDFSETHVTS